MEDVGKALLASLLYTDHCNLPLNDVVDLKIQHKLNI